MGKPAKLTIVRGTTNIFGISVTGEDGNPYILDSGQALVFGLKEDEYSDARLFVKRITNVVNGEYYLELTPADTAALEPGRYFYDIGLQNGSTVFFNVVPCSEFHIIPNITKLGDGA